MDGVMLRKVFSAALSIQLCLQGNYSGSFYLVLFQGHQSCYHMFGLLPLLQHVKIKHFRNIFYQKMDTFILSLY